MRRNTKKINIGSLTIGNGEPIVIQSMLSLPWSDMEGNIKQAIELEKEGCQIIRVAVPNMESVALISELKKNVSMPVVADIHFDWRLALASVEAGVDKIRINPGNIGSDEKVQAVANACKENGIPIRIGVNAGSVEKSILAKYGSPSAEAMVESALHHASLLEKFNFKDIVLSIKSNRVNEMMKGYMLLADRCDYPLHLGVTHTGSAHTGTVKSIMGIGGLLGIGIGDTFRVSLTAPPIEEIKVAKDILLGLGQHNGADIISCPTCGRCQTDVIGLTDKVEVALKEIDFPITVAVMGCVVNGPGEAKEADVGITGGNGKSAIFVKGKIVKTISNEDALSELMKEIEKLRPRED